MSAGTPGPTAVERAESRVRNADHDCRPAGCLRVPIGESHSTRGERKDDRGHDREQVQEDGHTSPVGGVHEGDGERQAGWRGEAGRNRIPDRSARSGTIRKCSRRTRARPTTGCSGPGMATSVLRGSIRHASDGALGPSGRQSAGTRLAWRGAPAREYVTRRRQPILAGEPSCGLTPKFCCKRSTTVAA